MFVKLVVRLAVKITSWADVSRRVFEDEPLMPFSPFAVASCVPTESANPIVAFVSSAVKKE